MAALSINTFVNADYIVRGLSGRNADTVAMQAGHVVLTRLKQLAAAKQDFAFESTLSSQSFALFLRQPKSAGLPSGDLLLLAVRRFVGRPPRQAARGDGRA